MNNKKTTRYDVNGSTVAGQDFPLDMVRNANKRPSVSTIKVDAKVFACSYSFGISLKKVTSSIGSLVVRRPGFAALPMAISITGT